MSGHISTHRLTLSKFSVCRLKKTFSAQNDRYTRRYDSADNSASAELVVLLSETFVMTGVRLRRCRRRRCR